MQLIATLEQTLVGETNMFRAQLLREDIVRLRKLDALARSELDADGYHKAARRLGWTVLDARTSQIGEPLDRLADVWRATLASGSSPDIENRLLACWRQMTRIRLETMVGCLATPVPKPTD
jgi:hypothetical protein